MIVLDASTLFGAVTSAGGLPAQAFRLACAADRPALSQAVWDEVADVVNRPRLARFVRPELRSELLATLQQVAVWFEPDEVVTDCRDAKDNKYLELALAASATTIVSSDSDLLVLHPWRGVRVLRPAEYLAAP